MYARDTMKIGLLSKRRCGTKLRWVISAVLVLIFIVLVMTLSLICNNDSLYQRDRDQKDHKACTPQTKIAFMKTHKTGSSSLQNIFFR